MIFKRRKVDYNKLLRKIGKFALIRQTEMGRFFGLPIFEVVYYYNGKEYKREPFSEEIIAELEKEEIPFEIIQPEQWERLPSNKIILGRLELSRLGLWEES